MRWVATTSQSTEATNQENKLYTPSTKQTKEKREGIRHGDCDNHHTEKKRDKEVEIN